MEAENNNPQEDYEKLIKKRRKITIISCVATFIVVFASTLVILLVFNQNSCSTSSDKLEVSNLKMTTEYSSYLGYSCEITGTATNVSGKNLSYAQLEFSVYDSNGYNIGTAYDNIGNLAKGDVWKFEAHLYYASSRPSSCKLVEITTL